VSVPIITNLRRPVSAIALASDAATPALGHAIERVWRDFSRAPRVQADAGEHAPVRMHWMLAFITGGWLVHPPHSIFDNSPL